MEKRLHSGELYLPNGEDIMEVRLKCLDKLYDFNVTRPTEMDKREELLKEMFAEIGEGCYIEPPFHANWGGRHCHCNVVAVGNPCKVLREVNEHDYEYYFKDRKIDPSLFQ